MLTEKQIPKTVTKNIAWLYPARMVLDGIEDTLNMASLYLSFFIKHPTLQISQIAMTIDQAYSLLSRRIPAKDPLSFSLEAARVLVDESLELQMSSWV